MNPPDAEVVRVPLGPRSYDIRIVSGDSDGLGPFARDALGSRRGPTRSALVVGDGHVAAIADSAGDALRGIGLEVARLDVPAGEASKSLEHAASLIDRLIALRADRNTVVVAVGGGVVGDLAGFAAATFARGVPLLMVPTTLLAMVDSSVGGKVAVNRPAAKNIVGAFHQPIGVRIDTAHLATLPPRELRCGMAEVIKYGAILDAEFFGGLERDAGAMMALDAPVVRRVVRRCCELKALVVSEDEREETGRRAVLNFGHTVGHAIEAVAGYDGPYRHGEAVAIGMVAECRIAERLGWIGPEVTDRLAALLRRVGLPTSAPGLDPDALLDVMRLDKKNRDGRVRFVLPRDIGAVESTDEPTHAQLRDLLC